MGKDIFYFLKFRSIVIQVPFLPLVSLNIFLNRTSLFEFLQFLETFILTLQESDFSNL